MYLSRQEVADYLAVSESYVRKVIEAGDTPLSRHLKCSSRAPKKGDPAPVRIAARELALFTLTHTRDGWESPRAESEVGEAELRAKVREIWEWLSWHRERQAGPAASQPSRLTASRSPTAGRRAPSPAPRPTRGAHRS